MATKTTHPDFTDGPDILAQGEHAGFEYLVGHNGIGYRCGYVYIPVGHPWHGKDYDAIDVEVHGGLTYARAGVAGSWWIGFDCAHCFDAVDPSLPGAREFKRDGTIRTTHYVVLECTRLCEQAREAARLATSAKNN